MSNGLNLILENDLEYLKGKNFDFGCYAGQARNLRRHAVDLWGAEEVASMTDFDIKQKFIKLGYIPVVINFEGNNTEDIYLVKKEVLSFAKCLER